MPRPQKRDDGFPTRGDMRFWSLAEFSISTAIAHVEAAGASEALTDAVNLLIKAKERVADHEEGLKPPYEGTGGWRPIETAPKDGPAFEIWFSNARGAGAMVTNPTMFANSIDPSTPAHLSMRESATHWRPIMGPDGQVPGVHKHMHEADERWLKTHTPVRDAEPTKDEPKAKASPEAELGVQLPRRGLKCPSCGGRGVDEYGATCLQCGGKGRVEDDGSYMSED